MTAKYRTPTGCRSGPFTFDATLRTADGIELPVGRIVASDPADANRQAVRLIANTIRSLTRPPVVVIRSEHGTHHFPTFSTWQRRRAEKKTGDLFGAR
jgi:hypothetical protein